ncbi:MAG: hypothetical protein ACYC0F_19185 [Rhodanobacter sp.]
MNLYEAQEFLKTIYPDKEVKIILDDQCLRHVEIVHTDGKPNLVHYIEYNKIKIKVHGQAIIYMPIAPHRVNCYWKELINVLSNQKDVYLTPDQLQIDTESLAKFSGLSIKEIERRKEKDDSIHTPTI